MNKMLVLIMIAGLMLVILLPYYIYLIYRFQITEYRWIRFKSMLRDAGILRVFFRPFKVIPRFSFRNLLILSLIYSLNVLFIIILIFYYNLFIVILLLISQPFIVALAVLLSWLVIAPYREYKKFQATKLVASLSKPVFIGITGSFGKSSVRHYLTEILSSNYKTLTFESNTDIGVALDILRTKDLNSYDYVIVEMGAYHQGEIESICNIVKPTHGILTGIGNQHMDLFKTKEYLVKAKGELLRALPENGLAVVNSDTNHLKLLLQEVKADIMTVGIQSTCDIKLEESVWSNEKQLSTFKIRTDKKDFTELNNMQFETKLLGKHNAFNVALAITMAYQLRIPLAKIQQAVRELKPMPHRLQIKTLSKDKVVLDDTYNSNREGFLIGMDILKELAGDKELFVVTRGIFELGDQRDEVYREILEKAKKLNVKILTTDRHFLKLANKRDVLFFENVEEMKRFVDGQNDAGVLLEGRL